MPTRMQQRRATAAAWTTANPVLAAGEIGEETDTWFVKIGDGTTTWANLPYYAMRAPSSSGVWSTAAINISPILLGTTLVRTLAINVTLAFAGGNPAANVAGAVTLVLKQAATGTGPFTVTWPTIVWAEGAPAPVMPTTANAELIVHLFWTGQAWRGMVAGTFFP